MKTLLRTFLLTALTVILGANNTNAQIPDCNTVYLHSGTNIYNYNPATNTTTINSIHPPSGASGLAVADNFFGTTPNPTFYIVISGIYHYWNGASWVSTGHSSGSTSAVNPGGAGPYIYNVDGLNNRIYRYNGTGNSTLFITLTTNGPYDCMGDANGNLYVINGNQLRMYDVNGQLACTYTLQGYNNTGYGGGYGIVNGIVYANNGSTTYRGVINGSTINFTAFSIPGGPSTISDFANCAFPPLNANIIFPGNLSCAQDEIDLTASTTVVNPIYSWTGPGIVSGGSTPVATINQPGTYTVDISSAGGGSGCANNATSSVTIDLVGASNFTGSASCVNDQPVYEGSISISSDMNTGTVTVSSACGGNQTFNLPITGGNGILNYQFTGNPGGPTDCDVTITFSNYPDCNQTVPVSNPNCCPVPTPTVDIVAPTCSNPGSASITNYNGAYTYTFTPSGPSVNSSGAMSGLTYGVDYTVSASDGNCTIPSGTFSVDSTKITPTVTTQGGTICNGDNFNLTAIGSPAGGTYSWNTGGTNATTSVSPTSATTYTITYDLDGCTNTASATINVDTLTIPVFDSYGPICQGNDLALPTTSNNGITGSWSPAFNANQTTTYTFTPSANQCATTQTTTVVVKGSPSFTLQYSNPTTCDGTDGFITILGLDPNIDFNIGYNGNTPTAMTSDSAGSIIINQLPQGDYSNFIVDWNGCVANDATILSLKDPDKPRIDAGPDQIVCPGVEVVLTADNPDNATIYWNHGVMDGDTFVPAPNILFYTVTAEQNGCIVTDSVRVFVDLDAMPSAQFIASKYAISNANNQVSFVNLSENAIEYEWDFGDGNISNQANPVHAFNTEYNYSNFTVTLIAHSDLDCVDTAVAFITIEKEVIFFVPNAFTPDGDEFNNIFKPIFVEGFDANEFQMVIFDRWGEIIFESKDPSIGWDGVYLFTGKVVPDGSYIWKIDVKVDGIDDKISRSGSVTVIR